MQIRTHGMKRIGLPLFTLGFLAGLFAGAWWLDGAARSSAAHGQDVSQRPASDEAHWLADDRAAGRDQLERHLRGLDLAMMEIGYRFNELHWAGRDRNWPYAQYQIEKIELALRLALERRPKRTASAKPFLDETIPFVKKAIEQAAAGRDGDAYIDALERLRSDCMTCHVQEKVPHFTVYFPDTRTSPIRPGDAP